MKPIDFFTLVARMREAQRNYFKTRAVCYIEESRRLEKAVDAEIERVAQVQTEKQNPKLF